MTVFAHCRIPFAADGSSAWLIRVVALALVLGLGGSSLTWAQEAEWIWSPVHARDDVPLTDCHFRKTFVARHPQQASIILAADDRYELYVNGRLVGQGGSTHKLDEHDISRFVRRGRNVVAVRVENTRGPTAALVARVMVRERDGGWASHSTDTSWVTNLSPLPLWYSPLYNDSRWSAAQSFGRLGETAPWDRVEIAEQDDGKNQQRFRIADEFRVQRLLGGQETGSIIAMAFNEFGDLLLSREGGPLLMVYDSNNDGQLDAVREYSAKVTNCQGILPLNGDVYVTCDGPDGPGLYRLKDTSRDGVPDQITPLVQFDGQYGEHGPHGITFGPDGMLYVVVGNHAQAKQVSASSPYRDYYEGDLLTPRYEDPGGHAAGIKAPGGVVLRVALDGSNVETVAGGLRNCYDLAFNRAGDLFVHDSDTESDMGMTWYRPTRLCLVTPGAEFGWRSGWGKWPEYYVDSLPSILDTGRGSPTGAVVYNHYQFPTKYHDVLFVGDWSQGQILAVRMRRSGSGYTASSEVFLEGQPLNVTDLTVGPDGGLYFVTGGRGTSGGLYRVTWKGEVPESVRNRGTGISAVIRQPQLQSAWSRQQIAARKHELDSQWGPLLKSVARTGSNPPEYRMRALDVMQLFGPPPPAELLAELSRDPSEAVRAKAADLMGLHASNITHGHLIEMLDDSDRMVARKACEALLRAGQKAPLEALKPLLTSNDRFEAYAARRLLERLPAEAWRQQILATDDHRLFIQGALALVIAHPDKENATAVIDRLAELMQGFVSDRDFVDMLRVAQVALMRGEMEPDDAVAFGTQLADEFPSGDVVMNRELVRLAAFLQTESILDRALQYLDSDVADMEKVHLAIHLRFLQTGWTTQQRLRLLEFFSEAQQFEGGNNYARYVTNVSRDFVRSFPEDDVQAVLEEAERWPDAAMGALYRLPEKLDPRWLQVLTSLDRRISESQEGQLERLQVGVVALLARSGDPDSLQYLREAWEQHPSRRDSIALGLAQQPEGDNWHYLVRSLPLVKGEVARELMARLAQVRRYPNETEPYRQVILRGLEMADDGAEEALALLESWTGRTRDKTLKDDAQQLEEWQQWFREHYPDHSEPSLPVAREDSKYQFEELLEYLASPAGNQGSPARGAGVYVRAQCAQCHVHGTIGQSMGPDLTSLERRFTKREILKAIMFPSHVISDQYAAKIIVTTRGRSYTGLVTRGSDGEYILTQADGMKVTLDEDEVEEITTSKVSLMPDGLLDTLSLTEISDLFAYLGVLPPHELAQQPEEGQTRR